MDYSLADSYNEARRKEREIDRLRAEVDNLAKKLEEHRKTLELIANERLSELSRLRDIARDAIGLSKTLRRKRDNPQCKEKPRAVPL